MDYNKDYFADIERYAPFSFFSPLTRRSKVFKGMVLKVIKWKERRFAATRADWIVKKFNPYSSLDVGTASGKLVEELLKRDVEAYGADISQFQIDNLPSLLKSRILLAEVNKLPFENKQFDLVSAYHILEHIEESELENSIRELARVSRRYIIVELPTLESYNAKIDPSHISVFSYKVWLSLMNNTLRDEWGITILRRPNYLQPFFVVFARR